MPQVSREGKLLARLRANPHFRQAPKDGRATVIVGASPEIRKFRSWWKDHLVLIAPSRAPLPMPSAVRSRRWLSRYLGRRLLLPGRERRTNRYWREIERL